MYICILLSARFRKFPFWWSNYADTKPRPDPHSALHYMCWWLKKVQDNNRQRCRKDEVERGGGWGVQNNSNNKIEWNERSLEKHFIDRYDL